AKIRFTVQIPAKPEVEFEDNTLTALSENIPWVGVTSEDIAQIPVTTPMQVRAPARRHHGSFLRLLNRK
ncbi:hypothetical protein A2U01_0015207, partial [Trifolium medium]|nr:hypothetical protein [Trifolium medium]